MKKLVAERIEILPPTWTGVLPLYLEVATAGNTEAGRKAANEELQRMARIADSAVTLRRDVLDRDASFDDPGYV